MTANNVIEWSAPILTRYYDIMGSKIYKINIKYFQAKNKKTLKQKKIKMIDQMDEMHASGFHGYRIRSKELHNEISKSLKVEYLSESCTKEVKKVNGIIFGPTIKPVVSMTVTINQTTKNVHFLVVTGIFKTYICEEVFNSFEVTKPNSGHSYRVLINNQPTLVSLPPADSEFSDANVIGTEYLTTCCSQLIIDSSNDLVTISMN